MQLDNRKKKLFFGNITKKKHKKQKQKQKQKKKEKKNHKVFSIGRAILLATKSTLSDLI